MEIWQGIGIMVPVLLASRFAVRSRLSSEASAELESFNEQWQDHHRRFIEELRLTARF